MSEIVNKFGIEYKKPKVFLLNYSGYGVAEYAGRTAYDSFEMSENNEIKDLNNLIHSKEVNQEKISKQIEYLKTVKESELLNKLVWAYHHESVIEHISFSFFVNEIGRGVLQELARHRIASYTVRSTRYTMSSIINAFNASENIGDFNSIIKDINFLIVEGDKKILDIKYIYSSLQNQFDNIGAEEFLNISASKEQKYILLNNECSDPANLFKQLEKAKQKRNVGDPFKHIVTDNWSVDLVMTMNLRSLKNFINLRDSGAAYFQIQWLAKEILKTIPEEVLKLIKK